MTRLRIIALVGALSGLAFAACSSDDDSSSSSTTASTPASSSSTEGSDSSTAETTPGTDTESSATTAADTKATSTTVPSTATTIARVVTDPTDSVHGGDTGPAVNLIQYYLVSSGYDIEVDGKYGPVTENAVRDFQKKNNLTEDGIVGPVTWSRLEASAGVTTTSGVTGTALAGTTTTAAGAAATPAPTTTEAGATASS